MEYVLLGLLALAWGIGTPLVALVALVRTTRLREANERLTSEVALLRRQSLPGGGLPPALVVPFLLPAQPVLLLLGLQRLHPLALLLVAAQLALWD